MPFTQNGIHNSIHNSIEKRIEDQVVADRIVMAPMAGVTDRAFRNLCRHFGANLMVSEMVTSDLKLYKTNKSQQRLDYVDEPGTKWVQIAGGEPVMMSEAARFNADRGADVIDINMGCPAKKVCNKAAGSALLRDEQLVGDILSSVVNSVDIPVTLKIRLGWCPDSINAARIAKIAEDAGICVLTVHGRTRACRFGGQANYSEIGKVVAATSLPVIANGDIDSSQKAAHVLRVTGAAAVMVGRAAQGRPWLVGQLRQFLANEEVAPDPDLSTVVPLLAQHVSALQSIYSHHRVARKHIGWFLDATGRSADKPEFNRLASVDEQLHFLDNLQKSHPPLPLAPSSAGFLLPGKKQAVEVAA